MTNPSRSRKRRGADTQRALAAHLATNGWPYATDAGAGRQGSDILGCPGLSWEIKARADFNPTGWLNQGTRRAGLNLVAYRPTGYGPARIGDWPAILRLDDLIWLLRAAGYGDPPTKEEA